MGQRPHDKHLLVVKEKHGTLYFHVPDLDALHKAALSILTGRLKAGYWYPDPSGAERPAKPDYSKEEIEAMKPGVAKEAATKQFRAFQRESAALGEEIALHKRITAAVHGKDGKEAWEILRIRSDYEYEQVVLEPLEERYPQHGA